MNNIILKGEKIKKYYGSIKVLNIDSIEIYEGCFNLILGTNGSGKTSLLKIIALVDSNYTGDLWYKGDRIKKDEKDLLNLRRKFSVIWQNPYLFKGSVGYNIGLPLILRGLGNKEVSKKVQNIASRLRINHLLKKSAEELSGGEKQKVSIARALITEPEMLFVDEPTTYLDYESNIFINEYFKELVDRGMTIVLITHDLYQIKNLAHYITVLKDGIIEAKGLKEKFEEFS